MLTSCILTPAVKTHVYEQHTAACPLLVFSHHLLKQTFKTAYRSMSTACVLTPLLQ